ncbi:MAG: shikimate dehydrogenase [Desulfobacterales bacterium]|nr:shikimate dehydrogenase [Desulfobacterales bacterium]
MDTISFSGQGDPKNPDFRTRVFCIFSDNRVFRTKSPAMFNAAIKHAGINGVYIPLMVEPSDLGKAIQSLRVLNMAGANITVPYKEKVIAHLDILAEDAQTIRAINTVTVDNGILKGFNTNAIGFKKAIDEVGYHTENKAALVFGSGGAARAVVFMLNRLGARPIFITGRNQQTAKKLAADLGGEAISFDELKSRNIPANLVINATSVSSHDESPEMSAFLENIRLKNCQWIIDLNYGRSNYIFQDIAQKIGTRFMDGIPMLAHQASESFALWTGIKISPMVFLSGL